MEQRNSFDISGFDDGAEEKLDIPRNQYFNERNNKIQTNDDFGNSSRLGIRRTSILRIFSILLLFASLCLFGAASIASKKSCIIPGTICLGLFVSLFLVTPVVDYCSSRKIISDFDYKRNNIQCQEEGKQENMSEQISISEKNNKQAKYNKRDYYNKNNVYRDIS